MLLGPGEKLEGMLSGCGGLVGHLSFSLSLGSCLPNLLESPEKWGSESTHQNRLNSLDTDIELNYRCFIM